MRRQARTARLARLAALAALAAAAVGLPASARAQAGRVAVRAEPDALLLGRACLDLDVDGRCGEGEPGIAGAAVRLADGRAVTADAAGRFHLSRLEGRTLRPGGTSGGAVALKLDGAGLVRVVELPPAGAALADLALPPLDAAGAGLSLQPIAEGALAERDGALAWPIEGRAAPGARVLVDGREVAVGADGRFAGEARLTPGRNTVVVAAATPAGDAEVVLREVVLVRPGAGRARLYPEAPRRVASMRLWPTPGGALLVGQAAAGAEVRVGGAPLPVAAGGAFAAAVPAAGGEVALAIARAGREVRAALPLPGEARRLEGVALGDLTISLGGGGARLTGRGAASAEGHVGPVRLAAGLDLDDRDREAGALLRPRDEASAALVPERPRDLATAGDGAVQADADPGRGRLWARADADGAALRLGWTRSDLGGDGPGRYDRALFGARAALEGRLGPATLQASAFGSASGQEAGGQAPARAVHEELLGTGGSLYLLSGGAPVAGSERVRLARRDPVTGLEAVSAPLVRGEDYTLDEATGRLWLARPLAAALAPRLLATGDPLAGQEARLLLDYLDAAAPGAARLAGGAAGAALGPLRLEARLAGEDGLAEAWRLAAARADLDLGPAATLELRLARSTGRLHEGGTGFLRSGDGGLSSTPVAAAPAEGAATALQAGGRGEVAGLGWSAWWREREAGFSDGGLLEPRRARERGADLSGRAGPLALRLGWSEREGTDERDPSGATPLHRRRATARASGEAGRLRLTGELLRDEDGPAGQARQAAAGLSAAWRTPAGPGPRLGLEASHLQAFAASGGAAALTFTGAAATLDWREGRLALRGGWGPDLGPRLVLAGERRDPGGAVYGTLGADPAAPARGEATGSVLGARSEAGPVSIFTEEQVAEDRDGLRAGRVVGAAVRPAPGLRLSFQAERGEHLLPGGAARARGGGGASLAWERGPVSLAARGELISEGGEARHAASGRATWAASEQLSLALHALAARGAVAGRRAEDLDAAAGLAWRAGGLAALLTLGRLEVARPERPRREAWLASGAATVALGARWRAGLGLHLAVQRIGGVEDDRLAGSARLEARVAGPVDAAVEYARRAGLSARVPGDLDAVRAEAGVTAGPARLALGWTLLGFAGDGLDPAADASRLFLRATLGL